MAEPTQRRADDAGGRFYEHPTRVEAVPDQPGFQRPARYISVTTALNVKAKPNLVFWAGNITAARAMGDLPKLMASILKPGCGRSRARKDPLGCGDCVECVETWLALTHHGEKSRRAREGTAAHDVLELWIGTGVWRYVPELTGDPNVDQYVPTAEMMAPYIARLQEWVQDFGLTPEDFHVSECTVWNHRLKYAGTLDAIVTIHPRTKKAAEFCARVNWARYRTAHVGPAGVTAEMLAEPVRVLLDAKSREADGAAIYTEHRLQLVGYRNAETMTPKGRNSAIEEPMLETDAAAILQVRPDGYTFRTVVTDGATMRAFEHVLALAEWDADAEEGTLVRAFPLPDGWKWAPAPAPIGSEDAPPKKAAPRKRAPAKKATAAKAAPARKAVTSPLSNLKHSFTGSRADGVGDDDIPY